MKDQTIGQGEQDSQSAGRDFWTVEEPWFNKMFQVSGLLLSHFVRIMLACQRAAEAALGKNYASVMRL
jgi:hypothetical protein